MTIVYDKLMALKLPDGEQSYSAKDTMFYALSLGLGGDPVDRQQLRFAYEKDLLALPTMPVVLATPGLWARDLDTGIDFHKLVHGEQSLTLHAAIPPAATVRSLSRITGIVDKGEGRGALVFTERQLFDGASGTLLATVAQTTFCRGDGGFGGPSGPTPVPHAIPERVPDLVCDLPTLPQMALLYRLNADPNPLHADPDFAAHAGFPMPILHGLATYGVAGHALLKSQCGYDPTRLKSMACRFTAPVYPGEVLRTEMWNDSGIVSFRTTVPARSVTAISNGRAEIAG
jgi:acyl dehydratase